MLHPRGMVREVVPQQLPERFRREGTSPAFVWMAPAADGHHHHSLSTSVVSVIEGLIGGDHTLDARPHLRTCALHLGLCFIQELDSG